jgi:hypothetical protein
MEHKWSTRWGRMMFAVKGASLQPLETFLDLRPDLSGLGLRGHVDAFRLALSRGVFVTDRRAGPLLS